MKRVIAYIYAAAMNAALLTGCIIDAGPDGHVNGQTKTITFTLPDNFRGTGTYAGAEAGENDIAEMDIYMFDTRTGMFERMFRNREITIDTPQSGNPTATIDMTERMGAKTFFFVANGAGITSELTAARYNVTTADEFERMVCDERQGLPAAPLLMSAKVDVSDIEDPLPSETKVWFTRRVARLDVLNDAGTTNFTIKNIFIDGFSTQGYVFGTAISDPQAEIAAGGSETIPFGAQPGANAGNTPSVFYVFPSAAGPGKAEIAVEGVFQGSTRVYTLDPGPGFSFGPNTRYILSVMAVDVDEIALTISAAEWDDGGDIPIKPLPDGMIVSPLVKSSGGGRIVGDTVYCTFGATGTAKLKFTTQTFWSMGTEVVANYDAGGPDGLTVTVNDPQPILTYGAYYEQAYEVDVDYTAAGEHVEVELNVINRSQRLDTVTMLITTAPIYPGTDHKPVRVGGVWWAPFNVGAKNVNGANAVAADDAGHVFQWGRSNGGWPLTGTLTPVQGPMSYSDAMSAANRDVFIKGRTYPTAVRDWLSPSDATLWNTPGKQVCPEGWRIPTRNELQKLADMAVPGKIGTTETSFVFVGDTPGRFLFLHMSHYRNFLAGTAYNTTMYWSSDTKQDEPDRAYSLEGTIQSGILTIKVAAYPKANGFAVRCVAIE